MFRSRSGTPTSHPGTPPQQTSDMLSAQNYTTNLAGNLNSGQLKAEYLSTPSYSDQLRNFAAKYSALHEYVIRAASDI